METPLVVESGTSAELQSALNQIRETAWANTDALVGIFSCSSEAMEAELAYSRPDGPLGKLARSWVHEHQHLYHTISTPMGVFCGALRDVQTLATRDVLILLRSAGVLPRLPLLRNLREVDSTTISSVRDALTVWLDAELFLTYQQGSQAAYESLAARYSLTRGVPTSQIFKRLQLGVAQYLFGPNPDGSAQELLRALAHEELVDPAAWRQEDRNSVGNVILSWQSSLRLWWLPMMLESACQAVEMWGDSFESFERLYAGRHKDLSYLYPITETASVLRSRSLPEILATHLAVCDLALAPPILPDRVAVRHGLRVDEMIPHLRFFYILNALETVGALRGPHGYSAFTAAICEHLHWTPPEEVFTADGSRSSLQLGVRGELFRLAAKYRKAEPAIFTIPFASYDTEMSTFQQQFAFHTLEFTDRVVHHKKKNWLYASQLSFICNEWLHGVMAGVPKIVVLPWRTDASECEFLAKEAQDVISTSLGWDVPPPRIVGTH
jgi:hypothetical protein